MKLYRLTFTVSGHERQAVKGGTSVEDTFRKILVDYRRAAKPPVLVMAQLQEDYGEHIMIFARDAGEECDELRAKLLAAGELW